MSSLQKNESTYGKMYQPVSSIVDSAVEVGKSEDMTPDAV